MKIGYSMCHNMYDGMKEWWKIYIHYYTGKERETGKGR